jgi:lysophospholipase L1-like esterase
MATGTRGRPAAQGSGRVDLRQRPGAVLAGLLTAGLSLAGAGSAGASQSLDCPSVGSAVFNPNDGWSRLPAVAWPLDVLAIGSSSTAGVGASDPAHTYPEQLEADVEQRTGVEVEVDNAGVSGETADQTIGRLEQELAAGGHEVVIWQVGTNDAVRGGDITAFRAHLQRGIEAAKHAAVRLVLLNQQFYPGVAKNQERYETYVHTVDVLGAENHVPVFSRYALMKAWSATDGLLLGMLSPDHFHMNDRGYGCVAAALADRIADIVPRPAVAAAPAAPAAPTAPVVPVAVSGK